MALHDASRLRRAPGIMGFHAQPSPTSTCLQQPLQVSQDDAVHKQHWGGCGQSHSLGGGGEGGEGRSRQVPALLRLPSTLQALQIPVEGCIAHEQLCRGPFDSWRPPSQAAILILLLLLLLLLLLITNLFEMWYLHVGSVQFWSKAKLTGAAVRG